VAGAILSKRREMKRVLIRPSFQDWCCNRLFNEGTSYDGVYQCAFQSWRETAKGQSFQLDTWDMADLSDADVLWFLDLPTTRNEFNSIQKQLNSGCKMVLQVLESPALNIRSMMQENWSDFDMVLSYQSIIDEEFFVGYRLPNDLMPSTANIRFKDRKPLLMINSNRVEGGWAVRQEGMAGLPGIGPLLSGWDIPWNRFYQMRRGELYSARRKLADAAEKFPNVLHIYGYGWRGEKISWCPLYPRSHYAASRGIADLSKRELASQFKFTLAFENFAGSDGYISEKLFDAFCAGSVPIYLGDSQIDTIVSKDSFVDARQFQSPTDLLQYVRDCDEEEWRMMKSAGEEALLSLEEKFGNQQFVDAAMSALTSL